MPWVTRIRVWTGKKRKTPHLSVVTVGTKTPQQAKYYHIFGTGSELSCQAEFPGKIYCPCYLGDKHMNLLFFLPRADITTEGSKPTELSFPLSPVLVFFAALSS